MLAVVGRRLCMIRSATLEDIESITVLLDRAFAPSKYESKLVKSLVAGARPIFHWVLEDDGLMVAYICYSRA